MTTALGLLTHVLLQGGREVVGRREDFLGGDYGARVHVGWGGSVNV